MSKWISVKECLPEIDTQVLCVGVDSNGDFLSPLVATLRGNGKFIVGYSFCGDRDIGFYIETFVTHWQPMIDLPVKHGIK